jgi:cytochrome c peroxidase
MRAALPRRICGLSVCVPFLLWMAPASDADVHPPGKAELRESYQRPRAIPYPEDNPYSAAKAELGRLLFFDPILSGSQSRSCSTCHNPGLSWGDGLPKAIGENQAALPLRAPTLIDVAWLSRLGWDGKFADLEAVTFGPITGRANMNLPDPAVLIARLSAIPGYVRGFAVSFGDGGINRRNIELALATYQRSLVAGEAPFDRWVKGDETAIDPAAKRGFTLFTTKARCTECHSGPSFTDGSFHDIGTAQGEDIGRGRFFPTSVKLRYAFKTPTLRDVARRGPYMHDGSVATLEKVVELYDKGGIARPSRAETIRPLGLSDSEKTDLIAFLRTLDGAPQPVLVPVLPR